MRRSLSFPLLVMLATAFPSCSSGFGDVRGHRSLEIEIQDREKVSGERLKPLPLVVNQPIPFRVIVRARRNDGSIDTDFNGYVRLSAKPGAISPLAGTDTEGRNVKLVQGESRTIDVQLANAYGTTFLLAEDLGYEPVSPFANPPPKCSNGQDDDGDGLVDFPADPGCAFANDDSEEGSTYAQGASTPIYFALPRIADVRGVTCSPACAGTGATPYPKEQVSIDTGYHEKADGNPQFDFNVVVSRISSDGFYATDASDPRNAGFTSVFAFNFNAPPQMRACDRLKSFSGTASEFFGFTQISYPTWTLEEWDPRARTCLVPDNIPLTPTDAADTTKLLQYSGSIVRVQTTPQKTPGDDNSRDFQVRVTPKFGPGNTPKAAAGYAPAPDATNCDFNKDGKIDFSAGAEEGACSNACTADPECTEYSNFVARSNFRLTLTDANKIKTAVQADASTSASFDPVALRGQLLRSFAGTLTYFSGGSQFTIEARCSDDIVVDLNRQPLGQDFLCKVDADCAIYGKEYGCRKIIASNELACRTATIPDAPDSPSHNADCDKPNECRTSCGGCAPPPLACVFPRTVLDNNPQ